MLDVDQQLKNWELVLLQLVPVIVVTAVDQDRDGRKPQHQK